MNPKVQGKPAPLWIFCLLCAISSFCGFFLFGLIGAEISKDASATSALTGLVAPLIALVIGRRRKANRFRVSQLGLPSTEAQTTSPPGVATIAATPDQARSRSLKLPLLIGVGIAAVVVLFIACFQASSDLELRLNNPYSVDIRNVGTKPIRIMSLSANNRDDCKFIYGLANQPFSPRTLQVGNSVSLDTSCNIVRVTVKTDVGTNTYEFRAK